MAEQTFRSPGFFEQEIDLAARKVEPFGTPAGVIGTALEGPAFVPVTIGSFTDFETKFGTLDADRFGPYAVREFLKNRTSLTYMRVLGAGANETTTHFETTRKFGTVTNAGFTLSGSRNVHLEGAAPHEGTVQFIVANHNCEANEAFGFPVFTDNDTVTDANTVPLVRGVVLLASGTRMLLNEPDSAYTTGANVATPRTIAGSALTDADKYFKIVVSSSVGSSYASDDGIAGARVLSASLDPDSGQYISKILNTDPNKFQTEQHLLYLHFPIEHELAPVLGSDGLHAVALMSGSDNVSSVGDTSVHFRDLFGRFDSRYTTPRTSDFISQPYGTKEYDLFYVETLSDGARASDKFKISIINLRASIDPNNDYGTFELQVRNFDDTDTNLQVLERYPNLTLDPKSDRYIARVIGDKKVVYDFDQEDEDERRLLILGKYPNISQRIRIRMNKAVGDGEVPADALPFGFRGIPALKTNDSLNLGNNGGLADSSGVTIGNPTTARLGAIGFDTAQIVSSLTGAMVPPMPYRFKVTRGAVGTTSGLRRGAPGTDERVDARFYWGVKTEKVPASSVISNGILNTNIGTVQNPLVRQYTKFMGIQKMDALLTGSGKDEAHNNKFTLARVAFGNEGTTLSGVFAAFTGSARQHMKEASYIRHSDPDKNNYTVTDPSNSNNRYTLASLVHTSSVLFNRFTEYAKFTNVFYGGFDGVNILDKDAALFRDRAFSGDLGGKAIETDPDIGIGDGSTNPMGKGRLANANASVRKAIDIMTDPLSTNINILAIPGVRDAFVTDHALDRAKDNGMSIYLMDTLKYDENGNRLFDDSSQRVDVRETSEQFDKRAVDNNYAATFFPDVFIDDPINNKVVKVPATVAALGTLGYNDNVSFPWFAPAGFNRGGLDFVKNVENRLTAGDRDTLYDARLNPIAVFPKTGFVIFGQKTLQINKSALDRINVRRLMLEVKRQVVRVADRILFEPNTPATRAAFVARVTPLLALIQAQAGIETFKVVMDDTNNSTADVESNRLNGRIVVVPTRAVEFIAIDFIITNSGVSFE